MTATAPTVVASKITATMHRDNQERMFELCRRITRESDPKRLALWIEELNQIIRRKIDELRQREIKHMQR